VKAYIPASIGAYATVVVEFVLDVRLLTLRTCEKGLRKTTFFSFS
jgi:hypothetical protein